LNFPSFKRLPMSFIHWTNIILRHRRKNIKFILHARKWVIYYYQWYFCVNRVNFHALNICIQFCYYKIWSVLFTADEMKIGQIKYIYRKKLVITQFSIFHDCRKLFDNLNNLNERKIIIFFSPNVILVLLLSRTFFLTAI